MGENVKETSDQNFEQDVLKAAGPVLVDFWAEWCAPCKRIAPVVDELAGEYSGQVNFVKVNIDHNPTTPGNYGVRGIPTLMLFKDGKVIDKLVGAAPKESLIELIKKSFIKLFGFE